MHCVSVWEEHVFKHISLNKPFFFIVTFYFGYRSAIGLQTFKLANKNHIYKQLELKAINKVYNIQTDKIYEEDKSHLTGN